MRLQLRRLGLGWSAFAALLTVAVAFTAYLAAVAIQHVGQPLYLLPAEAGVAVVMATCVSAAAAFAMARSGLLELAILSVVAAGLSAFGFITGFSIGPPFLLAGLVLVTFVLVRGAFVPRGWLASGGGLLLGFSSLFVVLMSESPPAVQCGPGNAVSTSAGYWPRLGGASGGGTASGGSGGRATGTFSVGSTTVHYQCEGGQLTEFHVEQAK